MARKPNVLVVFADQMRAMATGYAGNPDVITPHLDRLASEGCRFTRAFSNSPVCTPARGTLLTGLFPHRHGAVVNDVPIRTDVPTLGTLCREQGYAAGYVGKWHLDGVPRDRFTPPGPRRCGFDDHWAVHNCTHNYTGGFCYRNDSAARMSTAPWSPAFYTTEAIRFMESCRDRPFALVVSWGPPHNPYGTAPETFRKLYDPAALTLRPNVAPPVGAISEREGPHLRENLAGYYAHITALDSEMGRLMRALDDLGLTQDTIVVFTSDHGDMLLSHGYSRKQLYFDESINVPLICRAPGRLPAGRCVSGPAALADIVPTLCDLAGLGPAARLPAFDGVNLAPALQGRTAWPRDDVLIFNQGAVDEALAQGVPEWVGLRTSQFTYVRQLDGAPIVLYDNDADPWQECNLLEAGATSAEWDARLERRIAKAGFPDEPWPQMMSRLGIKDLWNERERTMHPRAPRLIR
ncbi:MAG: sulfatase [Kiritimatiellaeota bacterium]|nr:sulfatase [Kiritimatiellota bacterium]